MTNEAVQNSFWKSNQKALAPWLFLAPGMIMFLIYVVFPIIESIYISFYEWDGLAPAHITQLTSQQYVGLGNYRDLLDDDSFYTSLWNNLKWLLLYMLAVPIGLFVALFLNQKVWGIRLYKSLFFFPFVISQVVVGLLFSWFYAPGFGPLFAVIKSITGSDTAILASDTMATYGIIAAGLWPQTAYCMILYLTGLNNINPEQVEAARMDGARGLTLLWNIILPQLRPATFIAIVVTVIGSLRSFDLVSIMTGGGPYGSSRVLSYFMFEQALSEYGTAMGYGAAIAVVLFAIMMVFISFFIWRMLRQERNA
jgi:multiple sugar transport system permease protein